jgi:recombination protein RecA
MDEWQMGLAARVNGKFFRKLTPALKRSLSEDERPVTMFMINQYRDSMSMYGPSQTTPGGKAKNYYYYTRVELSRSDWMIEGTKKDGKRVGVEMKAHNIKNKSAPPQRTARMVFYYDVNEAGVKPGSYDELEDMFNVARTFNIIPMAGGGNYSYGEYKWRGAPAVMEQLGYDMDLQACIKADVYAALKK